MPYVVFVLRYLRKVINIYEELEGRVQLSAYFVSIATGRILIRFDTAGSLD
jgi:hypothetical protein